MRIKAVYVMLKIEATQQMAISRDVFPGQKGTRVQKFARGKYGTHCTLAK